MASIHTRATTLPCPCANDDVACFGSSAVPFFLWCFLILVLSLIGSTCLYFLANCNLAVWCLILIDGLHLVANPLRSCRCCLFFMLGFEVSMIYGECSWVFLHNRKYSSVIHIGLLWFTRLFAIAELSSAFLLLNILPNSWLWQINILDLINVFLLISLAITCFTSIEPAERSQQRTPNANVSYLVHKLMMQWHRPGQETAVQSIVRLLLVP